MNDSKHSEDPYRSPASPQGSPAGAPHRISRKVRIAWIAGIATVILQCPPLLLRMWEAWRVGVNPLFPGSNFYIPICCIVLTALLTYGIYRNSRLCTALMLAISLLVLAAGLSGTASDINDAYTLLPASTRPEHLINVLKKEGLLLLEAGALCYCFGMGVVGTFAFHRSRLQAAGA